MVKKRKAARSGTATGRPTAKRRKAAGLEEELLSGDDDVGVNDDALGGAAAVAEAVDLEVIEEKKEAEVRTRAAKAEEADSDHDGLMPDEKADPYLLADAKYIEKDTRWRNKQRTLIFCSRGVTTRFRHLLADLKKLLPHHKPEPKFEKRGKLQDINEIAELKSCNNVIYFEARKRKDLYMWLARVPSGPSIKFQVHNIHTTGEVRLAGNCLLGSRPLLYFEKAFSRKPQLRMIRCLLHQFFGTPRNHPKSKPFHDHIMCFYYVDQKIWFRHYQISPETPLDRDNPERQQLTEMGPRFVLEPIRMFTGSFGGGSLYVNEYYMSPTALRIQAKQFVKNPRDQKAKAKFRRVRKMTILTPNVENTLDSVFDNP